jgi:serine protease Do
LRSKILPLFRFDPRAADDRPIGQGTAFRIDPWSRCATAFHVVEDLFKMGDSGSKLVLRDEIRLAAALELHGLGYGCLRIPRDSWRPLGEAFSIFRIERRPFSPPQIRNVTELMMLRINPSRAQPLETGYLPMDLRRWQPKEGKQVLALGFADLDREGQNEGEQFPMSQYLYGSYGRIIDVEPGDAARGRPWPQFRVEADWPGGMSGGPVFSEAGHVIGVVSAGIAGQRVASATYFSGWNVPEHIFGSLDPSNPGWFPCWAVFDDAGRRIRFGQDRVEIETYARANSLTDVRAGSLDPLTDAFMDGIASRSSSLGDDQST